MQNNRDYFYKKDSSTRRAEFDIIEKIVGKNMKVIDLGCGDGSLMERLNENGNRCKGIEISQSGVDVCKSKGLDVIRGKVDENLPFKDKSFDFAVCNVTLHMVMYPEILLKEMQRISKRQVITFPNFAFLLNRIQLVLFGVFPRWSLFGYRWYSTGHIHQLSIRDFEDYCKSNRILIVGKYHLFPKLKWISGQKSPIIEKVADKIANLFATMAVFVIK